MKYTIRRISIVPALKTSAVMHAAFFLLFGVIYSGVIFILSVVSFASGAVSMEGSGMSLAVTLLLLIGLPILGLIYGAVVGTVFALFYNAIAEYVAPLRIELMEFEGKEEIEMHPKM